MSGQPASGEMTLAFDLEAFERLADPSAAVDEARTWSAYVGIVDNDAEAIRAALATHGVEQDFDLGGRDKWLALQEIRATTATPRHVYVGDSEDSRRAALQTGWEFLHITEAAENADWEVREEDEETEPGLLGRLRALFQGGA